MAQNFLYAKRTHFAVIVWRRLRYKEFLWQFFDVGTKYCSKFVESAYLGFDLREIKHGFAGMTRGGPQLAVGKVIGAHKYIKIATI